MYLFSFCQSCPLLPWQVNNRESQLAEVDPCVVPNSSGGSVSVWFLPVWLLRLGCDLTDTLSARLKKIWQRSDKAKYPTTRSASDKLTTASGEDSQGLWSRKQQRIDVWDGFLSIGYTEYTVADAERDDSAFIYLQDFHVSTLCPSLTWTSISWDSEIRRRQKLVWTNH